MDKKYFVTSDIHFNHTNIIKYCNRPFSSVEEMNISLINNWNKTVSFDDEVYVLGDFYMSPKTKNEDELKKLNFFINSLNGHKHLVKGNHDYFLNEEYLNNGFETVNDGFIEKVIYDQLFVMSHYQMVSWKNSYKGTIHLFGHEHRCAFSDRKNDQYFIDNHYSTKKYNVCVEYNNYKPIQMNEIIKKLSNANTYF